MPDGTTAAAITDLLKNVYGDMLTDQFHDEQTTYNQFEKSERRPSGKGYIFGLNVANPQSVGSRGDSAKLPDPMPGKYDQGTIVPKYHYGTLRTSDPAIELSKGNLSAFVEALAGEVKNVYRALVTDLNRQCWGDGGGKLASLSAIATPSTSTTWSVTCSNDLSVRYIRPGMLVDFYTAAGAVDQSIPAQRVSAVNPATKVITMEAITSSYVTNHPNSTIAGYTPATGTIPATSVVVKMGARDAAYATSDTPIEMVGLQGIYDDGTLLDTFEGINADNNPFWRANLLGNSSVNRELTTELMLRALDVTRTQSGMKVDIIRMGLGQRRKYAELLAPDVRFAPGQLRGGYEVLTFSGGDGSVEMIIDTEAQPNVMYFEPKGVIQKYELTPISWMDLDQQMHQRSGYAQYDQTLRVYTSLGCEQRNCLTLLKDLVEPDLY